MIQINVLAMPNNEICIVLNEYQIEYFFTKRCILLYPTILFPYL